MRSLLGRLALVMAFTPACLPEGDKDNCGCGSLHPKSYGGGSSSVFEADVSIELRDRSRIPGGDIVADGGSSAWGSAMDDGAYDHRGVDLATDGLAIYGTFSSHRSTPIADASASDAEVDAADASASADAAPDGGDAGSDGGDAGRDAGAGGGTDTRLVGKVTWRSPGHVGPTRLPMDFDVTICARRTQWLESSSCVDPAGLREDAETFRVRGEYSSDPVTVSGSWNYRVTIAGPRVQVDVRTGSYYSEPYTSYECY